MGSAGRRRGDRPLTDWIVPQIIAHPIEERRTGPLRLQGLFVGRSPEAAAEHAETTADELVTIANVAGNHMHGTQTDRPRARIRTARRPEADGAAGLAGPTVRLASGTEAYETPHDGIANETVSRTTTPSRVPGHAGVRSGETGASTLDRLPRHSPSGSNAGRRERPGVTPA